MGNIYGEELVKWENEGFFFVRQFLFYGISTFVGYVMPNPFL